MVIRRRGSDRPGGSQRAAWSFRNPRVGTRVILLLLVPLAALAVVTGAANWREVTQANRLQTFQTAVRTSFQVGGIADAVAEERTASVRKRFAAPGSSSALLRAKQAAVDRRIRQLSASQASAPDGQDVAGRLDAAARQLFALRSRAPALSAPSIQRAYQQIIDNLDTLERDLESGSPTRGPATAVFATLAIRAAGTTDRFQC